MAAQASNSAMNVRHFRQILLWPLQLMPIRPGAQIQEHWEVLDQETADNPWRELLDEFTPEGKQFQLRHYSEFVTFLPYVQRFLYGESRAKKEESNTDKEPGSSPMRVYRRHDIASVRVTARHGDQPIVLPIAHIDLYFFYDIDVVLLNVEVYSDDLTLHASAGIAVSVRPRLSGRLGRARGRLALPGKPGMACGRRYRAGAV